MNETYEKKLEQAWKEYEVAVFLAQSACNVAIKKAWENYKERIRQIEREK